MDSPPETEGVAAPSKKCRAATEAGADGMVNSGQRFKNSFGNTLSWLTTPKV